MISITDYTSLCKGNIVIITGPSDTVCPICGGDLSVRGTCIRKVWQTGCVQEYRLRVMECRDCHKHHREIPDFIIPYKRITLAGYCEIAEAGAEDYPCDTSTWQRIKLWLSWFFAFARSVEQSLVCSGLLAMTKETVSSMKEQTAYFVRLVVNSGFWIHNRSAMSVVS